MIHNLLLKETDLVSLKFNADKLDIDKLKNVPSNLSNLKSKADKLNNGKLGTTPVDLSKLNDVVKYDVVEKYVNSSMIKNTEDKIHEVVYQMRPTRQFSTYFCDKNSAA